jgi:competence protein ComEC
MSVGAVILFALMVGGGATVVRATIMVLVVILARAMGREGSALRALALAGGVMIFLNPLILFHDVSFQLSSMATLALVVFAPVIKKYFLWVRSNLLQEIVTTTFATQIFVLPLIVYQTGSLSLVSFVANIFILPVIPLVMFFTAIVALLSWVPFLGIIFSSIAHVLLSYIISVVSLFSHIPFGTISKISFSFFALIISYIVIAILIVKNYFKTVPIENRK